MDRLTVTAKLRTPFVSNGSYWTLDALLAAVIFDQCQNVELAHTSVPVRSSNDLFHASAAIIEPVEKDRISFVANLRADHALDPILIAKNKSGKNLHTKLGRTRRRDFGAVMNSYSVISADEICWFCEGDGEEIDRLLQPVSFIGKRRASGFGEVDSWSVEEGDLDGVTGVMGEPLRPVPVELFEGDKESIKVDAAWRPAYWHPANRAICFAPELPL
ncbi:hypothetical protein R0135_00590 [Congregibacter variabilis]|uniref:Uncharacterized protein n=1 Tax=Congregibacter variabilis TaxID=3081200 RepID=A0ABZ0I3R4_9GAMM|nr:hypothetical protein R0135_00590 [Congregibacter sp. IMCC43200]